MVLRTCAFGFRKFAWVLGVGVRSIPPTVVALEYGINRALIYLQVSLVVPITG